MSLQHRAWSLGVDTSTPPIPSVCRSIFLPMLSHASQSNPKPSSPRRWSKRNWGLSLSARSKVPLPTHTPPKIHAPHRFCPPPVLQVVPSYYPCCWPLRRLCWLGLSLFFIASFHSYFVDNQHSYILPNHHHPFTSPFHPRKTPLQPSLHEPFGFRHNPNLISPAQATLPTTSLTCY